MTGDFTPRPARNYSWAPFEKGNTVAVRSGAYSPRLIAEAARPLAQALVEALPLLAAPEFELELEAYCEAVTARRFLMAEIRRLQEAKKPVPPRSWESLSALMNTAHRMAGSFGLTPQGRARLGRHSERGEARPRRPRPACRSCRQGRFHQPHDAEARHRRRAGPGRRGRGMTTAVAMTEAQLGERHRAGSPLRLAGRGLPGRTNRPRLANSLSRLTAPAGPTSPWSVTTAWSSPS